MFTWVYDRFTETELKKAAFVECLEPYLLDRELTHISATVMKDFVNHYEKKGALGIVEACIVNVDIANVDMEQVDGVLHYSVVS